MARRRRKTTNSAATPVLTHEEIIDTPLVDELNASYMQYALSVIKARAIPDVRDGLKPVQRRILFSMFGMGLRPDKDHTKSAKITGQTMGALHPHGDSAIYEALVRLAQPFSVNVTLVDPYGNFGSLDNGPAAARYTEARPSDATMSLIGDITEESVDFSETYLNDGTSEPDVLPAGFPNLLVNGASGIAVGLATNMALHNLSEVVAGLKWLLKQPDGLDLNTSAKRKEALLKGVRKYVLGPDFPSGGYILGSSGFEASYATGNGSITMRAKVKIERGSGRAPHQLVVTELPYKVKPSAVIGKVVDLIKNKQVEGLSGQPINNSDLTGLRILIPVKASADPEKVLKRLYKLTPLQTNFSANNVVLVNNQPQTLGLVPLMQHYLAHRLEVITRRTEYRLSKDEAAAHIREGLVKALDAVDFVINLIRDSEGTEEAREVLMSRLELSEIQANYVLDLPLKKIARLESMRIRAELEKLRERIAEYKLLLEDSQAGDERRRSLVAAELTAADEELGFDRRSELVAELDSSEPDEVEEDNEPDESVKVYVSASLDIGRSYPGTVKKPVPMFDVLELKSRQSLRLITSLGRALKAPVASVPAEGEKPMAASEFAELSKGEKVIGVLAPNTGETVFIVTKNGLVKRVRLDEIASAKGDETSIIALKDGDNVVACFALADEDLDIVMVASSGQALRIKASDIASKGRAAGGMAGMKLPEGTIIAAGQVHSQEDLGIVLTVTDKGSAKVSETTQIPVKGRGGSGVRVHKFRSDESSLASALVGTGAPLAVDKSGKPVKARQGEQEVILTTTRARRDASGERLVNEVNVLGWHVSQN